MAETDPAPTTAGELMDAIAAAIEELRGSADLRIVISGGEPDETGRELHIPGKAALLLAHALRRAVAREEAS